MSFGWLHPRDQLVRIMQRIYDGGMTTLSGGNLSIRDANGDVWITPAGVDKGSLVREDIVCVHADGSTSGKHRPSSELPFHTAIYRRRPDLNAVVHAHPPALVSFSIVRSVPETAIFPQAERVVGSVGYAPYALPGSEALGASIAGAFEEHDAVLLENHGVATGGPDLLTAFQRLETLDFCARTVIRASRLGAIRTLGPAQVAAQDSAGHMVPEFTRGVRSAEEFEVRREVVWFLRRACARQLMISTEGVMSARVGDDGFVITPTGLDRPSVDVEDLVLVRGGKREAGKAPSRSLAMHAAIYERRPDVNAVMTAQPPSVLAFAVTGTPFDSKTIPESYILLRDVPMVPFGAQYHEPAEVAERVSSRNPVVLIENDCVLTVGRSLLEAFDRLEVAEFSAAALLDTAAIGALVPIEDAQIRELERKFLGDPQRLRRSQASTCCRPRERMAPTPKPRSGRARPTPADARRLQ